MLGFLPTPVLIGLLIVCAVVLGIDVYRQKTGRSEPSPAMRDGTLNIRIIFLAVISVGLVVAVLIL